MKGSLFLGTFALLSSMVAAAPLKKRDLVYEVVTEEVVETVVVTTTVWVDEVPATSAVAATTTDGQFFEKKPTVTSSVYQIPASSAPASSSPAPPPQTPSPTPTPTPTPSPEPQPSPQPEPSSVYTPPAQPSVAQEPSSVYTPPPAPVTTQQAPAYTPPAQPVYSAPAPASSAPASNNGGGSKGKSFFGDITYYNPAGGYGACGDIIHDSDKIVALSASMMGAQSNGNPLCGKTITISRNGKTCTAKVADKCPGCDYNAIDLSPAVWSEIASDVDGRGHNIEWWVNE